MISPPQQELRLRRSGGAQLGQSLEVQRVGGVGGLRCIEMRRQDEARDAVGREAFEYRYGDVDRWRSVVDTGQQMRVNIDHDSPRAA
jgi:hypothetical protein